MTPLDIALQTAGLLVLAALMWLIGRLLPNRRDRRRPRRVRTAAQARTIRAGIVQARSTAIAAYDVGDVRLYARAYLRTITRHGGYPTLRIVLEPDVSGFRKLDSENTPHPPDPLAELWTWLEHDLARQHVPFSRRPDRARGIRRYGATTLEFHDRAGVRRLAFFVTTPDLQVIDRFLPRGPETEFPEGGWSPVHDRPLAQIDADLEAAYESTVCPECVAGKHSNCKGDAWSTRLDERVECSCAGSEVHDLAVAAERKANG